MRGPEDLSVQVAEALRPDGVWQLWNYLLGLFLPSNTCFVEENEYIACPWALGQLVLQPVPSPAC